MQSMLFASCIAESGRTDVVNTIDDFIFTSASNSAFTNFTIVDDDVLEFDEIFIAEFSFSPEIANNWNARKGGPSTAFILIRDDDCELCSIPMFDLHNIYSTYANIFRSIACKFDTLFM